jgi:hypothetical protein
MGTIVDPASMIIDYRLLITKCDKQTDDFRLPPTVAPMIDYRLLQTFGSLPTTATSVT